MESPERQNTESQQARLFRVEEACDRFEAAWKTGSRPRIEDEVTDIPEPERSRLVHELILLEIDYRRLAGEKPHPGEFERRFPSLEREWLDEACSEPHTHTSPGMSVTQPMPGQSPLRSAVLVPAEPGSERAHDLRTLLHKRLRFIGLVILIFYVYFVGLGLTFNYDLFYKYRQYSPPYLILLATAFALQFVLWSKRLLSLGQLRAVELTLFGLVLACFGWKLACDLFFAPPFHGQAEWANTAAHSTYFFHLHAGYESLAFFILIAAYATLIPSNWRRCTLVVGVMAATPILISAGACAFSVEASGPFFWRYLLPMVIYLGIAVAIAAFGTRRIELLREEAAQARKLGQYQLKQKLGAGGMGEVYMAEHLLLKQPCAIKLIRPERAGDPSTHIRFEREVRATAQLKHPNTVQIYDYGHTADGTFYYVMEYLPGLTMEQLVKQQGPVAAGRSVHLLRQACHALREAHALGLVHRDIKPANIMVCDRGGDRDVVKLLDFGLVKAVGTENRAATLTQDGIVAGTPAYMSPEQAAGLNCIDARSDIYSLGATAYFLLTGRPPFPRDKPMQMIAAHIYEPAPSLTDLCPDVPADLQAVVLRCLEKDATRRFENVAELLDVLTACDPAGRQSLANRSPGTLL